MQMTTEQFDLVKRQFATLKERSPFYAAKFADIDLADVQTQEDFEKLPFSEKDDLRNAYPLGLQAVPDEEVVRIHSSSGTTGTPVIIPYTQQDVTDWAIQFARCYETAGITRADRIQITPGYGLWTAGIGFQLGAERLGAMAIPMGPGNTEKQLKMMQDLKSTVSVRHQLLRAAAGRGDRRARHPRQAVPAQGRHRQRALGRQDAPAHCGRAGRGDLTTSTASPKCTARASASRAARTTACTCGTTTCTRRSSIPPRARPCPTAKWASWC